MLVKVNFNVQQMVGFILTKWYVNCQVMLIHQMDQACFILTKWYVNIEIIEKKEEIIEGFILTKWYVNFFVNDCLKKSCLVLY